MLGTGLATMALAFPSVARAQGTYTIEVDSTYLPIADIGSHGAYSPQVGIPFDGTYTVASLSDPLADATISFAGSPPFDIAGAFTGTVDTGLDEIVLSESGMLATLDYAPGSIPSDTFSAAINALENDAPIGGTLSFEGIVGDVDSVEVTFIPPPSAVSDASSTAVMLLGGLALTGIAGLSRYTGNKGLRTAKPKGALAAPSAV